MRLFTRTFTFLALSYPVLAAHGAASFIPSGEIFFSAGWQDAYTAAGQHYVFTDEIGSVLSVPLPANTSHVAYTSFKLAEEGTYAFCIDCKDAANATVVDIRGAHHQNDSIAQPVTLFETGLDPTVQHLFRLFNVRLVDHSRVAFVSLAVTLLDNQNAHESSSTGTLESSTPVVTASSTSTFEEPSSESIPSTVTTTVTITDAAPSSSTVSATLSSAPTTSTSISSTSTPLSTAPSSPNSSGEPSGTAVTGLRSSTIAAIASLTGLGVISLLVGLLIFYHRRRRRREMQDTEAAVPHMAQPSYVPGPLAAAGRQPPARRSYSWLSLSNGNNVQAPPPAVRGPYRLGSTNVRGGSRPTVYDQV